MTHEEFEALLAGKLSGEISPADAERLAAELRQNPERAALAEGLAAAQSELRAGVPSLHDSARRMRDVLPPWQRTRPSPIRRIRLVGAVFRYAAVVGLAFGAGFWSARGANEGRHDSAVPQPRIQHISIDTEESVIVDRYARATRTYPKSTSLSHALLSLAKQ